MPGLLQGAANTAQSTCVTAFVKFQTDPGRLGGPGSKEMIHPEVGAGARLWPGAMSRQGFRREAPLATLHCKPSCVGTCVHGKCVWEKLVPMYFITCADCGTPRKGVLVTSPKVA